MNVEEFKIKLDGLKSKVEEDSKDLDLGRWEDSLCIVRTGTDLLKSTDYNSTGQLNQAAWIGENSGVLLAEIQKLRNQRSILCSLVARAIQNVNDKRKVLWWASWIKDASRDLEHCTKGIIINHPTK